MTFTMHHVVRLSGAFFIHAYMHLTGSYWRMKAGGKGEGGEGRKGGCLSKGPFHVAGKGQCQRHLKGVLSLEDGLYAI